MASTELMQIGEITPEFLEEWLIMTDSFFQDADDGLPRSVLNYGVNDTDKTIMLYTAEDKPKDGSLICDTIISYPGGNLGENVYQNLGEKLDRDFSIDLKSEYEHLKATYPNIDDLSSKVSTEYKAFIDDMKKQPPEKIIEAAYEITWKDSINQFIKNEDVLLSGKQLKALLSIQNVLGEIYEQWCQNGELHSYSDIQIALDDTANNILTALDKSVKLPTEIYVDEKPHKPSLSERIGKARAENPRTDAPKQDNQHTQTQEQEI